MPATPETIAIHPHHARPGAALSSELLQAIRAHRDPHAAMPHVLGSLRDADATNAWWAITVHQPQDETATLHLSRVERQGRSLVVTEDRPITQTREPE